MLAVTVMAVFVFAVAALITRDSWADKDKQKARGLSVRAETTTTTALDPLASTTTSLSTTTTVALPVSSTTSTSARPGSTPTTRASTGTTSVPSPTTTRPGDPVPSTTSTTRGPTGSFDQRSDNDATWRYGPNPQDRDGGSQGATASKGLLRYIVRGQATSDSTWVVSAEIINNSGREARFEGGVMAVLNLTCNGNQASTRLHDPSVTTMPAGGGVQLTADIARVDVGPGTCTMFGTIRYATV